MAKKANRTGEYAARTKKRAEQRELQRAAEEIGDNVDSLEAKAKLELAELAILAKRSGELPTDADRDIDFAYKNSGNPTITPLMCPSLGAWKWYEYARMLPDKFLEICAKREDAKAKQAGTITSQRMEDDKRQQFSVLDRIERQLTVDVNATIDDLMEKFPREVLRACRKHKAAWNAFIAEECK
jgi:hypothetical protein